jgi:hypothetical protein
MPDDLIHTPAPPRGDSTAAALARAAGAIARLDQALTLSICFGECIFAFSAALSAQT